MDLTQRLPSDDDEDDLSMDRSRPAARLHMFSGTYGQAQDYDIYPGKNIIGRHAKCDITLPAQSVSKKHAILEVEGDLHTISDCGSLNKTRRGKVAITPHVRYSVADGDFLMFADVACRYTVVKVEEKRKEEEDDTAVQTESEDDSILVPGTQATLAIEKTPGAAIRRIGRGAVLARDSGEEDEHEEEEGQSSLSEGKGVASSRDNYKVSAIGTFSSPFADTFVPESDEEGDTSVSQSRLPSLNLRCDSDIDTPTKRESLAVSSLSFSTSPTSTEKKIPSTSKAGTSNGPGSDLSMSNAVKDKSPLGQKDQALTEDGEKETSDVKEGRGLGTDSNLDAAPAEEAAATSSVNPDSSKSTRDGTSDTSQPPRTKGEAAEMIVKSANDVEDDDVISPSNKDMEKAESTADVPDSDADIEDSAPTSTTDAKKTGEAFHVDSDTDIEDDVAATSGAGLQAGESIKQAVNLKTAVKEETEFHLNSDTDVEEEEAISVSAGIKKRKAKITESDTDVDEEEAISVNAAIKKREAIISDSDTDVEEEEAVSINAGIKKRKARITESDTDVEEEEAVSISVDVKKRKARISDSDTDVDEEEAISVNAGVKKREAIISDSDTDVESDPNAGGEAKSKKIKAKPDGKTDAKGNDERPLKTDAKQGSVPFNLDSDTNVEDEASVSPAAKKSTRTAKPSLDIQAGGMEDIRTARGNVEPKALPGFHVDSDTDVDEADDEPTEPSTAGEKTGEGDGCDTEKIEIGEVIQTGGTALQREDLPVKSAGTRSAAAGFHMDSDTDEDEDDSLTTGPGVEKSHGTEDDQSRVNNDDVVGAAGRSSDPEVTADPTLLSAKKKAEGTPKTDSEGGEYDACATQCYLEAEDRASDQPDEDNCAEEATQAFIFSSTWAEADLFKRPADPIGVLQISPVRISTSEEETDENVMAETQPYLCENAPSVVDCVQETVQTDSECAETSRETQPLSHGDVSQDDTQPVSQYLAARPTHETGTWLHLKRETPACGDSEGRGEGTAEEGATRSAAPEGVTRSAAPEGVTRSTAPEDVTQSAAPEDVTQPYTLHTDGETTQSYAEDTSALEEDVAAPFTLQVSCTEDSVNVPASNPEDSSGVAVAAVEGNNLQPDRLQEPTAEDSSLGVISEEASTSSNLESKQTISSEGQTGVHEVEEKEGIASSAEMGKTRETLEEPPASPLSELIVQVDEERGTLEKERSDSVTGSELVTVEKRRTRRIVDEESKIQETVKEAERGVSSRSKRRNKTDIDAELFTSGVRENVKKKRATRKSKVEKTEAKTTEEEREDEVSPEHEELRTDIKDERLTSVTEKEPCLAAGEQNKKGMEQPREKDIKYDKHITAQSLHTNSETQNDGAEGSAGISCVSEEAGTSFASERATIDEETSELKGQNAELMAGGVEGNTEAETDTSDLRKKDEDKVVSGRTSGNRSYVKKTLTRRSKVPESGEEEKEEMMPPAVPVEEEVSVNRRSGRGKGRASRRNVGDQEQVLETVAPPGKLTSKRKAKKTEEELNEQEETIQKTEEHPTPRRTRRNSKEEASREQKEGKEKSEEEPPVSRRTRKNSVGEGTSEQKEGKTEEDPANRVISRRTRKNSRDEEDKLKTEQETTDPTRKSRSAKRDAQDKQAKDEEAGIERETSRRNKRECKEVENVVPSRQKASRRTRRNSKEEEGKIEEKKNEPAIVETAEEPEKEAAKQTSRRGKTNSREMKSQSSEAEQTPSKVTSKVRNPASRTRRKKQAEDDEDLQEDEATKVEKPPAVHEEEKSSVAIGRSRRTKDVVPPPSTPVPSRKRGQGPKDGGAEVKRKKSEETEQGNGGQEQPSPLLRGTRGRRVATVAEVEAEDGNDREKGPSVPPPSPAGIGRQKPRAPVPTEVQTPRRTNRSSATAGSSSPYVPHQGAVPKVLFTGVVDSAGEETILALGGGIAESVFDCTHLVTDRVRRTVKFLCALARGVPIVTLDWLEKCKKSGCFLSPAGFLVNDKEQEKNFGFVLSESLQKAKRRPLFEGYEIHVTENVKPEPENMKDIIRCAGATFLPKMPRTCKEKCVIVSCQEDASRWKAAPSAAPVTSAEFILSGILRQEANPTAYLLNPGTKTPAPTPAKRRR